MTPMPKHPAAMSRPSFLSLFLATSLLGGCAAVVDPAGTLDQRPPPASAAAREAGLAAGTPARDWWRAFNDPMLDGLVTQAMDRNHGLQATLASVQAARALAEAAMREGRPQGRLEAQAQHQRPSVAEVDPYRQNLARPPASRLATLGQDLAWEIDLFGRVGTAAAVAERRADAGAADLQAATALLQAEVVRHYTGLRQQQQALSLLAQEADALAPRSRQLQARVSAGLADRREALAARADESRVAAERAQAQARLQQHLDALALLTARTPGTRDDWSAVLLVPAPLPEAPAASALRQPGDLLARRPDVVRAEARLRAAIGETALAERAHLPRLSLNATFGLNAALGQLGQAGALRHAVGPMLSWDWLDGGRLQAQAAAARAGQQAAWHQFEDTVLQALQDSEASLRQWAAARSALAEAEEAEALARQAAAHGQARASAGLEPSAQALALTAQQLRTQRSTLDARAAALLAHGQVQLALGAWQPA